MNNTKNLTLNSQLDYWNGQKKMVSREGKGMNPRFEPHKITKDEKILGVIFESRKSRWD